LTDNGKTLKEDITAYKISATEANKLYQEKNETRIGHIVHMFRAIKE
jgi:hypothetical protein